MNTTLYTYRIPFQTPFNTANGTFNERKGLLIKLETDAGTIYSEAAPLPGYSIENFDDVLAWLKNHRDLDLSTGMNTVKKKASELPPPAIQFAIDALFWQKIALEKQKPLHTVLFESSDTPIAMPMNATIGLSAHAKAIQNAERFVQKGYQTLKIKIGSDLGQSFDIISEIRRNHPDVALRVDANQSLSLGDAKELLTELEPLNIAYIEEPLKAEERHNLETLKQHSSIKLAADESIRAAADITQIAENAIFDILILKPMQLGSFRNLFSVMKSVFNTGLQIVLTSSLESAVGRLITAHLAVGLSDVKTAQGLATGYLLQDDFIQEDQYIANGSLNLTSEPGLGQPVKIDKNNITLEEITP